MNTQTPSVFVFLTLGLQTWATLTGLDLGCAAFEHRSSRLHGRHAVSEPSSQAPGKPFWKETEQDMEETTTL